MIQFRGVTKEFKGNVVLSDISMDINDGELTVLIGPSGCGKTTTLKMINRLIPASKGEIFIDEKNIEEMDKVQLRRNMGYVIQQGRPVSSYDHSPEHRNHRTPGKERY